MAQLMMPHRIADRNILGTGCRENSGSDHDGRVDMPRRVRNCGSRFVGYRTGCSALGVHKKSCEAAPEAFQALNRTSKSLGQCLPVTKNEFRSGAKAMPFKTSW
jgi:hypothetical protein